MRQLLLLCCHLLLAGKLPANAQASAAEPTAPVVVRLDSGDVARQRYVCVDTTTYAKLQTAMQAGRTLLAQQALDAYDRQLADKQLRLTEAELARCRGQKAAGNTEFNTLATQADNVFRQVQIRPPLLLDGRLYRGMLTGVVLSEAIRIFFFHTL